MEMKGIKIGKSEIKVLPFADDMVACKCKHLCIKWKVPSCRRHADPCAHRWALGESGMLAMWLFL